MCQGTLCGQGVGFVTEREEPGEKRGNGGQSLRTAEDSGVLARTVGDC